MRIVLYSFDSLPKVEMILKDCFAFHRHCPCVHESINNKTEYLIANKYPRRDKKEIKGALLDRSILFIILDSQQHSLERFPLRAIKPEDTRASVYAIISF